jgi:hypothetical protein
MLLWTDKNLLDDQQKRKSRHHEIGYRPPRKLHPPLEKTVRAPLRDVNHVHSSQPENHLILPTLEIGTIKYIRFE